ncbi:MAG: ROK family protein [Candidatus Omnitrophica bacterium]|nr:ROK family protein [Candidatus Omnitrophota bacterium]
MSHAQVVIGVDIGGTKITAGAVDVTPEGLSAQVAIARKIPTPRAAPPAFYDAIADIVRSVRAEAQHAGRRMLPLIGVAHPGRLLPDGALARGTTPNLGTAPGQFDGLKPSEELASRLSTRVIVENDAVAQMRFGLDVLLRDPTTRRFLVGETAVYLGPGTGMGGGVARVDAAGMVTPVTDGHFFDMQLPGYGDGRLTAEELFTGPAIARCVAEANRHASVPIHPATAGQLEAILTASEALPEHFAQAQRIADQHGDILAAIILAIHAGAITKVRLEAGPDGRVLRHVDEPDRTWSADDRAVVRGAKRFLFGGFVGCSKGLGGRIRARALEELGQHGLTEVMILQLPAASDDAGLLGAVRAIPPSALSPRVHASVTDAE